MCDKVCDLHDLPCVAYAHDNRTTYESRTGKILQHSWVHFHWIAGSEKPCEWIENDLVQVSLGGKI